MANLTLSLKTALISTGVISMAVLFKVSAPFVTEFVTSGIPSTYGLILSFLRPPYLYLLINCIIISIVASSKLQAHKPESPQLINPPEIVSPAFKVSSEVFSNEFSYETAPARVLVAEETKRAVEEEQVKVVMEAAPLRSMSMEIVSLLGEKSAEKPPVSKRFAQRKAVKAVTEGKALRVSKPKRHDTLESTWKTITEGRPMPLTRHLKKSDTWEQRAEKDPNTPPPPLPNTMKKSDTFNERPREPSPTRSSGSAKLKRDPSLSQDELNRRVEAFIKKFNEEMRLQRQESLNQYQEMLRRGAQ
ncbi:cytochrome c-type bioproteinsis ccda-like chloroplastic protein 2 [Hibiscus syriacus]|uniref:Cytochrome c-type bioproteinsis ccda-like chloroplastic protein 2 n=1 Tax=Hibiscus syriacus TaxID=106335 RepID=A0A6A2YP01_HIBSY|nr:translation initiation factor IF-2-like [Hibiscus syriacus]KAE8681066.1 cytochrome c-type bioproteinsis ccda-like chloroplastic protein 2 [Hibiscus syriacus]